MFDLPLKGRGERRCDELLAMGIVLKDGKDPQTGKPVTTWEPAR
jgi:cysteinyl-tRNA synthetase